MVHNKWFSEALVCTWISSRNLVAHIDAMTNRIDNNSHVIPMIEKPRKICQVLLASKENYCVRNM